ncbi:hypothetical protein K5549_007276 [Capra hircus]|nr:hypothetical protein K5549_007276 [Capra hircus]
MFSENYCKQHRRYNISRFYWGLGDGMVEAEFVEALQECGTISSVVVMPKRRQALVEFEDVLEARNAMNYATDNQI